MYNVLLNYFRKLIINKSEQVGAVVTHYHFDHTGGTPPPPFDALGIKVPGVREFATEENLPVRFIQK